MVTKVGFRPPILDASPLPISFKYPISSTSLYKVVIDDLFMPKFLAISIREIGALLITCWSTNLKFP